MKKDWAAVLALDAQTDPVAARIIAGVAVSASRSLARIARAHEEYASGRCSVDRLVEVVRQETQRAARQPRQATRRSGPVRG